MSHYLNEKMKMHYENNVTKQLRVLFRLTLSTYKAMCHYKNIPSGIVGVPGTPDQKRSKPLVLPIFKFENSFSYR